MMTLGVGRGSVDGAHSSNARRGDAALQLHPNFFNLPRPSQPVTVFG